MTINNNLVQHSENEKEKTQAKRWKSLRKRLEDSFTALSFAEINLPDKARQYLDETPQNWSLREKLEEFFVASTFAESNMPDQAKQYLDITETSQNWSTKKRLEDSFVASSFAEQGSHMIAQEYLESQPPLAGRVYGDIVYWGTVVATVLTIFGQIFSFVNKSNFLPPSYVLSSIWQQTSVEQIWRGALGHMPHGHWYLKHLSTGPGITETSLALGVFIVIPAMVGSGLTLFKERNRFFGSMAMTAALITTISMVGLLPLPVG